MISVVVPVFNEENSIWALHHELSSALEQVGNPYEIVYVDDGSTDSSYSELEKIYQSDSHVKVVKHRANMGQTQALVTAFKHARGDVIVTIDADLQHDPRDIAKLLGPLAKGKDAVVGWRTFRKENFLTRTIPSHIMNSVARKLLALDIHDFGCGLKAYRAECVRDVIVEGEGHLYLPAAVAVRGYKVGEVKITARARTSGSSKFRAATMRRQLLDLLFFWFLVRYWRRPLHFFGSLGLTLLILGLVAGAVHVIRYVLDPSLTLMSPLLLVAIFLVLAGVQFITTGVLFEIEMRPHTSAFEIKPATILDHNRQSTREEETLLHPS